MLLDMRLRGDSIYTVELRSPAALASYVSFAIKFFAIHQNMGQAQWRNKCWQKLTVTGSEVKSRNKSWKNYAMVIK
jgi:hypothetical protein